MNYFRFKLKYEKILFIMLSDHKLEEEKWTKIKAQIGVNIK